MSTLICYDGSPSAKHAVAVAGATLAHKPATLLHVWNPPVHYLADSFSTADTEQLSVATLERLALDRAEDITREGTALAQESGLTVQSRIVRNGGAVWNTILDVAADVDAELIVLGTRGHTAVQSALLGSVSNTVAHHSKRPVLLVPA